ncbi:MAG: enoyl-CoA hydratase-related protein [Planctomycetota bacterium]
MDTTYDHLLVENLDGGLWQVTVNRPDVLNALNDATIAEIDRCFTALRDHDDVRAVVLTGAGPKSFVAGADISELAGQSATEGRDRSRRGQVAFGKIESLGKPVLAAINGFALGGGCELALACHVRYASDRARLGLPEVTLGIIPGYGGTQRLERMIGRGRALELVMSGDMVDAAEAHRIGLVNRVFPGDGLIEEVHKIARTMISRGPIAVRFAIEAILRGGDGPLAEGLALESDLFGVISSTEDVAEGMAAFLEKRSAAFKGR